MSKSTTNSVEIKGTRKGLAIALGAGSWSAILDELESQLLRGDAFFQNSQVRLDTAQRHVSGSELRGLMTLLGQHGVRIHSVLTQSDVTASSAQQLGLRIALPEVPSVPIEPSPTHDSGEPAIVIRRTLRSGQAIRHRGHIVVIGDVNPGAEVEAGGNIVVWGRARGMLHAGAFGDNQAIVCALELQPTQLRVGSLVSVSPEAQPDRPIQPEVACVADGQIIARPWTTRVDDPRKDVGDYVV